MLCLKSRILCASLAGVVLAGLPATCEVAQAAPVFGERLKLRQPDGSLIEVRVWGDEFHQIVESLDGHTLVRDPSSGVICYARLSDDRRTLTSTETEVGRANPGSLRLPLHLRPGREAVAAEVRAAKAALRPAEPAPPLEVAGVEEPQPAGTSMGDIRGLCLVVDFPDDPGTIPPGEVDSYCNQVGYSGFGNNGSVRDYFHDVSIGRLNYTNYVPVQYYRALHAKPYYDDPNVSYGARARELILEALNNLETSGFDFSPYDADHNGRIDAINCLYAGTTSAGWAKGLWPHCGTVNFFADGVYSYSYQITDMGSSLKLSTFCHENGHMICNWPDLYDYGYESTGVGSFCLMCYSASGTNPVQPCAYLKYIAGWAETTLLTAPQADLPLTAGTNAIYKFTHPTLTNEYYLIENRQQTGRDSALPDSGLALWHVDTLGSNDNQQMTPVCHYKVTLVQADGRWDLEHGRNYGDPTDLWKAPDYVWCSPGTVPDTNWWDGGSSGLAVGQISASGSTMTFNFGAVSILLSAQAIDHTIEPGQTVPDDSFTVAASSDLAALTYTIEYDPAWLTVSPTTGSSSGEADTITIRYAGAVVSAWPKGTYQITVSVRAPGAINSPQSLVVRIIVDTVGPDFDGDKDVDQNDFGHLQACLTGAGAHQDDPACQDADLDHDQDVDQNDASILLGCLSGPDVPAGRKCDAY
jgi:M6 family metalloprotease-like protein